MHERPRRSDPPDEPGRGGGRRSRRARRAARAAEDQVWPPTDPDLDDERRPWPAPEDDEYRPWPPPEDEPSDARSSLTWPPRIPEPGDDLPPSARWYGTPIAPPERRPGRLRRVLLVLLTLAAGAGVIAVVAVLSLRALPSPPPERVDDPVAGVSYPLPERWLTGTVPPVTEFTSAAGDGVNTTVMVMPAEPANDARATTTELSDLYARLLLHGDEVKVVDDTEITVGARTGHTRALRAEYLDVVNRPAYLRVVFLAGAGKRPVVVVAMTQPDDPVSRAEIDTVIAGLR
ncbi:hypothetical protein [Streptosporangium sp. NPDC006930]|uniref:hypothetical protein n=1 Tax=Streptosporangium sp. NPDC006930 TaxID=3154783 RepID=UPI00341BC43D